uniref:Uncharacterized protein n=2 Tax=Planktothrix pseudagardhii TaxID=132604 RepID=A0A9W4CLR5_9CYAN|nr:hypothetical protein NO713_02975 [Planktothrix pseudagardhii]
MARLYVGFRQLSVVSISGFHIIRNQVRYDRDEPCCNTTMSINLTSDQEQFIQTQLESGKYQTPEQVISTALRLLDEWQRAEAEWVKDVADKIDAAVSATEENPPLDGETFINGILERFKPNH